MLPLLNLSYHIIRFFNLLFVYCFCSDSESFYNQAVNQKSKIPRIAQSQQKQLATCSAWINILLGQEMLLSNSAAY